MAYGGRDPLSGHLALRLDVDPMLGIRRSSTTVKGNAPWESLGKVQVGRPAGRPVGNSPRKIGDTGPTIRGCREACTSGLAESRSHGTIPNSLPRLTSSIAVLASSFCFSTV